MMGNVDLLTAFTATCVGGYIALALDYVAQAGLGFSDGQIRSAALFAATILAALVAVDFFGKKPGKAK